MTDSWETSSTGIPDSKQVTKPDPQLSSTIASSIAPGYVPISAPGWGAMASIIPDTIQVDLDEALGISAYVKRGDRHKLASKDLERLVTNITSPLENTQILGPRL